MPSRLLPCVPLLWLCSAAAAQQPQPAPTWSPSEVVSITRNAGLRPDGPRRLLGGGADYQVVFTEAGMRFVPALGRAAPTPEHLALTPVSVARGDTALLTGPLSAPPRQDGLSARYAHARGVEERYDVGAAGVELSWRFDERPPGAGDLVVRYAVDTTLPAPVADADGGLAFATAAFGGVAVGGVTGVDADGVRCEGALRWQHGRLELSLPAAFVDEARYPLVLDPLVGTQFGVETSPSTESEPDVAYDASTATWLVVYLRVFNSGNVWPRAQRVSTQGNLVGTTIFFSANGICERPRVANLGSRDRFGVVWEQDSNSYFTTQFAAVDAATGSITHTYGIAVGFGTKWFKHTDIGGDSRSPVYPFPGFSLVYEDEYLQEIRARRIWFDATDTLGTSSAYTVLASVPGIFVYSQPAVSRAAGDDRRLMVVARRLSPISQSSGLTAAMISTASDAVGPTGSVLASQSGTLEAPDVDGFQGRYVVAWQEADTTTGPTGVAWRSLRLDGQAFDLGATQATGGTLIGQARAPTVGYTPGRSWLGYWYRSVLPSATTRLYATAVDSLTGVTCGDQFSETITGADTRIVTATMTSGGSTTGELSLVVFGEDGDIRAQRMRNHGNTGSYTNVGGGCGAGGAVGFSHLPGIGSSGLLCSVSGLPPTALATVFNLSPGTSGLPCGPCVWTPFSATLTPPIVAGQATVEFPIPCQSSLVGSTFEVQWTTIDLTQAPCPLFPGLSLSDRTAMTIGG